jgi:C4-dicarboxylate-specific signal transduction histidine kinase
MPKRLLTAALILLAVAAICVGTFNTSVSASLSELQHSADQRLELYATSLDSEIQRFSRLPAVLDLMPTIDALLHQSGKRQLQNQANQALEKLSARTGALAIYIQDLRGQVVATSNWRRPDSYLGENDAYRPYFQQALHDKPSHFFGIGTSRSEPGYYLSQALYDGQTRLGVAVVKISLEQLERSWAASRAMLWVTDSNGVVIISPQSQWKFSTLGQLSQADLLRFEQNRQYNRRKLQPLQIETLSQLSPLSSIIRLPAGTHGAPGQRYLTQTRQLSDSKWQLTMLSSLGPVYSLALMRAALAGGVTILLVTGLFWLKERRRRLRERLAAREALQQAYLQLERKVEARTADLSASNQLLQAEISERVRAEQHLRKTQDELLQAGKMAVIGQLSTEVAHELNQPLAALRTLSGNTVKYLARGDLGTASTNLATIGQLVERMGKITAALRSFAHKPQEEQQSAHLGQALDHALFLLEQRIRQQQVEIVRQPSQEDIQAHCHPNRLEQLLINLLANALDAMADQAQPRISISCRHLPQQRIALCITDNGPGLSPSALEHLFEPFFTTKPAEVGLGLGLALSASIATEAGGSLSADNLAAGGAVFTVTLPLAFEE